jgi:hypothetical protein
VTGVDPFGLRPGDCYRTQDIAASNALADINPESITKRREFAGWIYRSKNGWYSYTSPRIGESDTSSPGPRPSEAVARYHTHGGSVWPKDNMFSDRDLSNARSHQVDSYVGVPSGVFLKYDRLKNDILKIGNPSPGNADSCGCDQKRVPSTFSEKLFNFIYGDF